MSAAALPDTIPNRPTNGLLNWLVSNKPDTTPGYDDRKSATITTIPPGLHLSDRRGPQVELYDVAGVHLLSSATDDSFNKPSESTRIAKQKRLLGTSWLSNCSGKFTKSHSPCNGTRNDYTTTTTPIVLSNSNTQRPTLSPPDTGRLPRKTTKTNGDLRSNVGFSAKFCSTHPTEQQSPCVPCFPIPALDSNQLTMDQFNSYVHGFSLWYQRSDCTVLLLLLLFVSLVQVACTLSFNLTDQSKWSIELTRGADWSRLVLLSSAAMLSLVGILCAQWQCSPTLADSNGSTLSDPDEWSHESMNAPNSGQVQRHVATLLAIQHFRRRLVAAQILSFGASLLLVTAMLPWLALYQWIYAELPSMPITCPIGSLKYDAATAKEFHQVQLPVWRTTMMDPTGVDSLWTVLWISVAVHGLFQPDSGPWWWVRPLRSLFTILSCIAHLVLSNVLFAVLQFDRSGPAAWAVPTRLGGANVSSDCAAWWSERRGRFLTPSSWWDDRAGVLCRTNLVTLASMILMHWIGQTISQWTGQHRLQLFLTATRSQTGICRLLSIERKMNQLARSLVPAPLAGDLVQDFIAGHVGWQSPLIIYLRNVSFLSAELVGLSASSAVLPVSSSLASSTCAARYVAAINSLFNSFDRLARSEGAYRVRLNAAEYLCVAGYPDTRVDHARCCVDLGLAMLKVVDELTEMTQLHLELRVAVHTGTAYAAVLGRSRLGFELTGEDVTFVGDLRQVATRSGRVLASRATFNQLPEGFRGEAGPVLDYPRPSRIATTDTSSPSPNVATDVTGTASKAMETYFVQPRSSPLTMESTVPSDRPKLTDLTPNNLGAVDRLATAAGTLYQRMQNAGQRSDTNEDAPLGFLFNSSLDEFGGILSEQTRMAARLDLLRTLSLPQIKMETSLRGDTLTEQSSEQQIAPARDPSTTELLALAAVNLAQSFDSEVLTECSEKLVPCQRRAGRLRGKAGCPKDVADPNVSSTFVPQDTLGLLPPTTNASMGTSQATVTTCTMNHSAVHGCSESTTHRGPTEQESGKEEDSLRRSIAADLGIHLLQWPCVSPPGQQAPHWFTLNAEQYQLGGDGETLEDNDENGSTQSIRCCPLSLSDRQRIYSGFTDEKAIAPSLSSSAELPMAGIVRRWSAAVGLLLIGLVVVGLVNLVTVSGSFWFLLAYLVAFAYLSCQCLALSLLRQFPKFQASLRALPHHPLLLVSSFAMVAIANLLNLSMCQPALLARHSDNTTSQSTTRSVLWIPNRGSALSDTARDNEAHSHQSFPLCPIPLQFVLLSSIVCLLPGLVCPAALVAVDSSRWTKSAGGLPFVGQSIRAGLAVVLVFVYTACGSWLTWSMGMFHELQASPSGGLQTSSVLMRVTLVQNLVAPIAFALLALMLPRGLEFQSQLMRQWIFAGRQAMTKLHNLRLALARLLVSTVPRPVISHVCDPSLKMPQLYAKAHPFVGVVVIQLAMSDVETSGGQSISEMEPPSKPSSTHESNGGGSGDPSQMADRLRVLNRLICTIDTLATQSTEPVGPGGGGLHLDEIAHGTAAPLIKVHVGGTSVGYATDLFAGSDSSSHNQSLADQMTSLLQFTERILEVCEDLNAKARSATNTVIHVRVAMHAGPALLGLIGERRPVFTIWGQPIDVCLHLLQDSRVPVLSRQHLLLATDAVIRHVPAERWWPTRCIRPSISASQTLVWRCVDIQTGRILLTANVFGPEASSAQRMGHDPASLPLHFCSVPVNTSNPSTATSADGDSSEVSNRATSALIHLARRTSSGRRGSGTVSAVGLRSPQMGARAYESVPRSPETRPLSQFRLPQSASTTAMSSTVIQPQGPMNASPIVGLPNGQHNNNNPHPIRVQPVHAPITPRPMQPIVSPPALPPHQRVYPTSPLAKTAAFMGTPMTRQNGTAPIDQYRPFAIPCRTASEDFIPLQRESRLDRGCEPNYCEPPATMTRPSGGQRRRAVVSQCSPATNEYSVVNMGPPSPCRGRINSHHFQSTTSGATNQPNNAHCAANYYWPNQPVRGLSNGNHVTSGDCAERKRLSSHDLEAPQHAQWPIPIKGSRQSGQVVSMAMLHPPSSHRPAGDLRPISISSTDSFLAAERACAKSPQVREPPRPMAIDEAGSEDIDAVSHHNPLYTDNEYESMTESHGNLLDAISNGRKQSHPRTARSGSQSMGKSSASASLEHGPVFATPPHLNGSFVNDVSRSGASSLQGHRPADVAASTTINGGCSAGFIPGMSFPPPSTTAAPAPIGPPSLDFPDLQRPRSPKAYIRQDNLNSAFRVAAQNGRSGSSNNSSLSGRFSQQQPVAFVGTKNWSPVSGGAEIPLPSASNNHNNPPTSVTSVARIVLHGNTAVAVTGHQANGIAAHMSFPSAPAPECPSSSNAAMPSSSFYASSEIDGTEAEYAGTYSIGIMSMIAEPSVAGDGITSCDDGDYEEGDEEEEGVENFSQPPKSTVHSFPNGWPRNDMQADSMTDSLLANPDLDAQESEIGDELDAAMGASLGLGNSSLGPSLLEAALLPYGMNNPLFNRLQNPTEPVGEEVFAYHARPGFGPVLQQPELTAKCHETQIPHHPIAPFHLHMAAIQGPNFAHLIRTEPPPPIDHSNGPTNGHSLPAVAPVHLPNFTQMSSADFQTAPSSGGAAAAATSDYDNLSCSRLPPQPASRERPRETWMPKPSPAARRLAAVHQQQQHHHPHRPGNNWLVNLPGPGDESDAMSGYIGDAASSVYDTDDDDDDKDEAHGRRIYRAPPQPPRSDVKALANHTPLLDRDFPIKHANGHESSPKELVMQTVVTSTTPVAVGYLSHLGRMPSNASSQTSGADHQRSEYDNIDKSNMSSLPSVSSITRQSELHQSIASNRAPMRPSRPHMTHTNNPRRVSSSLENRAGRTVTTGSSARRVRGFFDAEIAVEARRISRQFRAMGWLPASINNTGWTSPDILDDRAPPKTSPRHMVDYHDPVDQTSPSSQRQALFLLPMATRASLPCSRQTSLRSEAVPDFLRRTGHVVGDSETTMTSVTSQFDYDEDLRERDEDIDARQLDEVWDDPSDAARPHTHRLGCNLTGALKLSLGDLQEPIVWDSLTRDAQLGLLLMRPRSLSATCLLPRHSDGSRDLLSEFLASSAATTASSNAGMSSNTTSSECDEPPLANGMDVPREVVDHDHGTSEPQVGGIESNGLGNSPSKRTVSQTNGTPSPSDHPINVNHRRSRHLAVRRSKSSRANQHVKSTTSDTSINPGFHRMKRRAARVRSLLPAELQPFVLPGCMSSLSRSSSIATNRSSRAVPITGSGRMTFLSLTRPQHSQRSRRGSKNTGRHVSRMGLRSISDPELQVQILLPTASESRAPQPS